MFPLSFQPPAIDSRDMLLSDAARPGNESRERGEGHIAHLQIKDVHSSAGDDDNNDGDRQCHCGTRSWGGGGWGKRLFCQLSNEFFRILRQTSMENLLRQRLLWLWNYQLVQLISLIVTTFTIQMQNTFYYLNRKLLKAAAANSLLKLSVCLSFRYHHRPAIMQYY